jgi:hypothetical protein
MRQIDHVLFEREHRIDDPACLARRVPEHRHRSARTALAWSDDTTAQAQHQSG